MTTNEFDDLYKFAQKQFGLRPTPLQFEIIKRMLSGEKVVIASLGRRTGKTVMRDLYVEYKKYLDSQKEST